MIAASLSYFDIAVLGVLALSCLFAFFRGFVKEILSLGAWIGAGIITLYFLPDVAKELEPRFRNPIVAGGVAALGLYVVSLLCFSVVNSMIMRLLKEGDDVGMLDNALGLAFGAFRGAFVVSLGYLLLTMMMGEEEFPSWVKAAHTRPAVEKGAILLARAAPDYLREISTLHDKMEGKEKSSIWPKLKSKEKEEGKEEKSSDNAKYELFDYNAKAPAR